MFNKIKDNNKIKSNYSFLKMDSNILVSPHANASFASSLVKLDTSLEEIMASMPISDVATAIKLL